MINVLFYLFRKYFQMVSFININPNMIKSAISSPDCVVDFNGLDN